MVGFTLTIPDLLLPVLRVPAAATTVRLDEQARSTVTVEPVTVVAHRLEPRPTVRVEVRP